MIQKTVLCDEVLEVLRRDLAGNLHILGYLEHQPEAEILAYDGDISRGVIVKELTDEDGEHEWTGIMLATSDEAFLRAFWEGLPAGHKYFLPLRREAFEKLVEMTVAAVKWQTWCKVFVYNTAEKLCFADDEAFAHDVLTAVDVPVVESFWEYHHDDIHLEIAESIEKRPSSCVRIGGELAAWCLVGEDGSLGPVYVREEHRRKGLGYLVAARVMKKELAAGKTPFVHINDDNEQSLSLIKKFPQMIYSHDAVWFGLLDLHGN